MRAAKGEAIAWVLAHASYTAQGGPVIPEEHGMVYDKMLASALREAEEQARLLGASAERELALRAEIERLRADLELLNLENGRLSRELKMARPLDDGSNEQSPRSPTE